jgi:hypothetical protein
MAADTNPPSEQRCDGIDHGLPEARVAPLINDAYSYNKALQANELDGTGKGNSQTAVDAGKAFYEELVQLPIGERRALLSYAETFNKGLADKDPAMPTLKPHLDSDGFLRDLTVSYPIPVYSTSAEQKSAESMHEKPKEFVAEDFVYQGRGMCAEFKTINPAKPQPQEDPWPTFDLPALRLFNR